MADAPERPKGYSSTDRRRVDERGRRRRPLVLIGVRDLSFDLVRKELGASFKYFRAQLEHHPGPRQGWARSGRMLDLARGFVLSSEQLYASTISVMADTRPRQVVLAGGILARALLEGLGNLFALLEDPNAAPQLLLRDDFLSTYRRTEFLKRRYKDWDHARESKKLQEYGLHLGLSQTQIEDPEAKKPGAAKGDRLRHWPTPKDLLKNATTPPRLLGERRLIFQELYGFWYGSLSAYSHHRLSALQLAIYAEEQPNEGTFAMAKSATASLALVVALCVLAEVEAFFGIQPSPTLRKAWELVRDVDELSQATYDKRYRQLLGMPARPG